MQVCRPTFVFFFFTSSLDRVFSQLLHIDLQSRYRFVLFRASFERRIVCIAIFGVTYDANRTHSMEMMFENLRESGHIDMCDLVVGWERLE